MMPAPSATARLAASSAAPNSQVAPRSKNESGVRLTTAMTANEPGGTSSRPMRSILCGAPGAGWPAPSGRGMLTGSRIGTGRPRRGRRLPAAAASGKGPASPLANMTAVSGRRMAETVARRGGLAVQPRGTARPGGDRGQSAAGYAEGMPLPASR